MNELSLDQMRMRHLGETVQCKQWCEENLRKKKDRKSLIMQVEGGVRDRHLLEEKEFMRRVYGDSDGDSVVDVVDVVVVDVAIATDEDDVDEDEKNEELASTTERTKTKAQKRREKKERDEKARELAVELEKQRLKAEGPSKKELEETRMKEKLRIETLKLKEVKADGHCLYRAVAEQVQEIGEENRYKEVREICAKEMLENRSEYEAFVEVGEEGDGGFDTYCEKVKASAEWGGHVEMLAIARALKRDVEVYEVRPNGDVEKTVIEGGGGDGGNGLGKVRLAFMQASYSLGEHYDAIVPQ